MFNLFKYPVLIKHELECPGCFIHSMMMIALYQHHVCELRSVVQCAFVCNDFQHTLSIMHWTWKWQRQRFIVLFRFAVAMEWFVYLNNTDGHRTPDGHSDRQTDRQRRLSLRWMFTYFISVMDQKTSLKLKLYVCVHQFDLCERESDKWTRFRAYVRDFS